MDWFSLAVNTALCMKVKMPIIPSEMIDILFHTCFMQPPFLLCQYFENHNKDMALSSVSNLSFASSNLAGTSM